jgi:hypothetical protein
VFGEKSCVVIGELHGRGPGDAARGDHLVCRGITTSEKTYLSVSLSMISAFNADLCEDFCRKHDVAHWNANTVDRFLRCFRTKGEQQRCIGISFLHPERKFGFLRLASTCSLDSSLQSVPVRNFREAFHTKDLSFAASLNSSLQGIGKWGFQLQL